MGSIVKAMLELCRHDQATDKSIMSWQFRQEGGRFIQTLPRPRPTSSAQVNAQVEDQENPQRERLLRDIACAFPSTTAHVTAQVALLSQVRIFNFFTLTKR